MLVSFSFKLAGKGAAFAATAIHLTAAAIHCRALDTAAIAQQRYGNDSAWYHDRIPFLDSSDDVLNKVYYYRWNIFRAHQRDLGDLGYISTEFLDDVSWQQQPYASLNDATGFHLGEGRWCRDRRFKEDYLDFMFAKGGNDRHFSDYMAHASYQTYLVDGDQRSATSHIESMKNIYGSQWGDHLDATKGLYWIVPLDDATEYTIASIDASGGLDGFTGGAAFRPSINAYMFANFKAIAAIAQLAGQEQTVVDSYNARASDIKKRMQADLWNATLGHFIDRFQVSNKYVQYYEPIRGRELVGMVPWLFDLPDDKADYAGAWKHVFNTEELMGKFGLRTNEPSYEYYMRQYRYEGDRRECQWNGPSWPFQTTQTLLGLANLLDHYKETGSMTRANFHSLLSSYVDQHIDSATGEMKLQEDYDPDNGGAIVGLARSPHYFHSGFVDIVISGLAGIRPRSDDVLEVNPMVDESRLEWFRLEKVPYHGRNVAIQWDRDGRHFGQGAGLRIEDDDSKTVLGSSPTLQRITVPFARKAVAAIERPFAKSVQLQQDTKYPRGVTSTVNDDPSKVHDAIDGRVWFWNALPNGWESVKGASAEQWYAIEFANDTETSRAELAFYQDGTDFAVPQSYRLQASSGDGKWSDIPDAHQDYPLANGITNVVYRSTLAKLFRVLFEPSSSGKQVRIVEFKLF